MILPALDKIASQLADHLPPESPPEDEGTFLVPLTDKGNANVQITNQNGLLSLIIRDSPMNEVLSILAQTQGLNVVTADGATARVSVTLNRVRLEDALSAIVAIAGYQWTEHRGIIHVTPIGGSVTVPPEVQGRRIEVIHLDYASATDVQAAVQGMLSPAGQAHIMQSNPSDNRQTKDAIVVEDLPGYVDRVLQYIQQIDQPPRQVLIEAHILEVELDDTQKWGINWDYLIKHSGNTINFQLHGLANPDAVQSYFTDVDGDRFTSLIEWLQTTTDAKTLASPKVLVVNGQQARIQIGDQLGYRITTVTETSALESVDFLDVGVVLSVTPHISRDGHILMKVKPEVSSGQIDPETELPAEETTEVETNVLLRDGHGLVIGGLIQENDSNIQSKVPFFGDIKYVGKLFQRKTLEKSRSEIIVALMPRIVPYTSECYEPEAMELMRTQTRLFHGPLHREARPWEPRMPDAITNPIRLKDICHTCFRSHCTCADGGISFSISDLPVSNIAVEPADGQPPADGLPPVIHSPPID